MTQYELEFELEDYNDDARYNSVIIFDVIPFTEEDNLQSFSISNAAIFTYDQDGGEVSMDMVDEEEVLHYVSEVEIFSKISE